MIFWLLAFPFALGTLFFIAFGSIYKDQKIKPIKVAVVEKEKDLPIVTVLKEIKNDDKKMLKITFADDKKANKLLDDKKVTGIIYANSYKDVKLTIKENGIYQSILKNIVVSYHVKVNNAEKNISISDKEFVKIVKLSGDNKDPYLAYFYNLIAMICLLGSTSALEMLGSMNKDEEPTGFRILAAPVSNLKFSFIAFLAIETVQLIVTSLALLYFMFVLKINFGGDIPYVFLTAGLGTLLGSSLGFFVTNIKGVSLKSKNAILIWITLGGGFLAGLMMAQMKVIIEEKAPIINKINPASVLTDAFYTLNIFGISERYMQSVIYILVLSFLFLITGSVMVKKQ